MLFGPLPQTVFFFLLVDDLPHIFLHEFAFWDIFECYKSPTFSYFSFGLALDELTFGHRPIATVLATEVAICTGAFVICDTIETIRPTEGTCAFAFLLFFATRDLFWSVVWISKFVRMYVRVGWWFRVNFILDIHWQTKGHVAVQKHRHCARDIGSI